MKRTLFYMLAFNLILHTETGIVRAQNMILEAYMRSSEMRRGEQHLYIRVFADGQVEYEDLRVNAEAINNVTRRSEPRFVLQQNHNFQGRVKVSCGISR